MSVSPNCSDAGIFSTTTTAGLETHRVSPSTSPPDRVTEGSGSWEITPSTRGTEDDEGALPPTKLPLPHWTPTSSPPLEEEAYDDLGNLGEDYRDQLPTTVTSSDGELGPRYEEYEDFGEALNITEPEAHILEVQAGVLVELPCSPYQLSDVSSRVLICLEH